MISRAEFVTQFTKAFGEFSIEGLFGKALMCIRTKSPDGDWYYGAPFLVGDPFDFYFKMLNLETDVFERMFDCSAELCHIGEWSFSEGWSPFAFDEAVFVPLADLFKNMEDIE